MMDNQMATFSGMLNQHEFKERYMFTMQRIENCFSREDLAFLFGRTSYHVIDYEQLSDHLRMDSQDHEVMAALFRTPIPLTPAFNNKFENHDISTERRMIRGFYIESEKESYYQFTHPWTIKGINKPITINTHIQRDHSLDGEIVRFVTDRLNNLIQIGYFDTKCTPLMIYHHIHANICPEWRHMFAPLLKKVIYEFILTEKLCLKNEQGHSYYQIKL